MRRDGVGPTQLAYAVFWATYDVERWPGLWAAIDRGLAGDLADIAGDADSFTRLVPYTPFAIVSCLDSPHPTTYDDWQEAADSKRRPLTALRRDPRQRAAPVRVLARGHPGPTSASTPPAHRPSSSSGSPATPPPPTRRRWRSPRRLAAGSLLTVDQEGHVAIGDSDCADAAITRYLVDLRRARAGTRC